MEDWLKEIDLEKLKRQVSNRKIYIWGKSKRGGDLYRFLINNGFKIYGFIDSKKSGTKFQDLDVYSPEFLKNDVEDKFILLSMVKRYDNILTILDSYNYSENKNFLWFDDEYEVTLVGFSGEYCDNHGNKIISKKPINNNIEVHFKGSNNKLIIGENLCLDDVLKIEISNTSTIEIGKNSHFFGKSMININNVSDVKIEGDCEIKDDFIIYTQGGNIVIGKKTYIGKDARLACGKNTYIHIGDNCLISSNIIIRAFNGHSLFDMNKKENISMKDNRYVKIGNHVWIGMNSTILFPAEIGDGCVIGAISLVKNKKFPNNCVIAGNPAKVIRENVEWIRKNDITYEEYINSKNSIDEDEF